MASQQELADLLGMSRESIAGYIMRLTRKGAILGKGYILPKANHIVVIGGANADIAGTSLGEFQQGDSNPGSVQQSAGGVGRNIAENLARLGNAVSLIALVGRDSRGQFIIDQAIESGIQVQDIVQHAQCATSTYLALHSAQGELLGSIADMSIMDQLTPELLAAKMPRIQSSSLLVVDANLPSQTLNWLAEQELGLPIAADAVSAAKADRLRPLLSQLTYLKVNRFEALTLLQKQPEDNLSNEDIVDGLHEKGVTDVILSLSEEGVMVGLQDRVIKQTVPACNMVSDTGAGDALLAGYVHAKQQMNSDIQAINFAQACAATTLEAASAVNATLTDGYVKKRFADFLTK